MEGTAGQRTLHQDQGRRQSHLKAIATGEVTGADRGSDRPFTQQQPLAGHLLLQNAVMPGIGAIERGTEHCHRGATRRQTTLMGGAINSLRQAAHHRPAGSRQRRADATGHQQAMAGRPARADHRHGQATGQGRPQTATPSPVQRRGRTIEGLHRLGPAPIPG